MTNFTLVPAYGRDYTSKAAVLEDWNANKDFQIADATARPVYINKQDADASRLVVRIRYNKLRKIMVVRPEEPA